MELQVKAHAVWKDACETPPKKTRPAARPRAPGSREAQGAAWEAKIGQAPGKALADVSNILTEVLDAKGRTCRSPEELRAEKARQDALTEKRPSRAVVQLRQLLDFYFEPFTLQHNRYLLDLIMKNASAPQDCGPWLAEALYNFRFTFEDLKGLGRIQSALSKLPPCMDWTELEDLKHLKCGPDGTLFLRTHLEVRNFICAEGVPKELSVAAVRYLSASKEEQQKAPSGIVSATSYSIGDVLADWAPSGAQRLAKVKRQILVYRTDLICLQGLDAKQSSGANLATSLAEEGYSFACGKANAIFWDRSRWEMLDKEDGDSVLAVRLRPLEDPKAILCAVSSRPAALDGSRPFDTNEKVLVCTDLSSVGGVEAAGVMDQLIGLPSVAEEILGEEVAAHVPAPPGLSSECELAPVRAGDFNRLRRPDGLFFQNVTPISVLSGHTNEYLASMPQEDVVQQFPCFRLPLVAAFHWQGAAWTWTGREGPAARTTVRL